MKTLLLGLGLVLCGWPAAAKETQTASASKDTGTTSTAKETKTTSATKPTAERTAFKKRILELNRRAAAGDNGTRNALAALKKKGMGMGEDYINVFELEKQAAKRGDPEQFWLLGMAYSNGYGGMEPDPAIARTWWEKGALLHHPKCLYQLGAFYYEGKGVQQSSMRAKIYLCEAAELGNIKAMINLSVIAQQEGDVAGRINFLRQAVSHGSSDAMLDLGYIYLTGDGVTANPKQAFDFFKKASENGRPTADVELGKLLLTGEGGIPRDLPRAAAHFRRATQCEGGQAWGLLKENLGLDEVSSSTTELGARATQRRLQAKSMGTLSSDLRRLKASDPALAEALKLMAKRAKREKNLHPQSAAKAVQLLDSSSE